MSLLISTISFPLGTGQFIAGDLTTHDQVASLFSNFTWTNNNLTVAEQEILNHWQTKYSGVYINLVCYIVFTVSRHFFI